MRKMSLLLMLIYSNVCPNLFNISDDGIKNNVVNASDRTLAQVYQEHIKKAETDRNKYIGAGLIMTGGGLAIPGRWAIMVSRIPLTPKGYVIGLGLSCFYPAYLKHQALKNIQ